MKRLTLTVYIKVLVAFILTKMILLAAPGSGELRVGATYLSMANKSEAFSALGINFPENALSINSKVIPELDYMYNFNAHFSTLLVLTIPQTQTVTLAGVGKLGTFKHLPPVLAVQYHFLPTDLLNPYIGVGLNYTLIYDSNLIVTTIPLALDTHSFGLVGQAGVDIDIGHSFYLNLDIKKVGIETGVYLPGGSELTRANLDPWLFSAGCAYRF